MLETIKTVHHCYIISVILYDSERWAISHMKEGLAAEKMWFCRRMMSMPKTEHVGK